VKQRSRYPTHLFRKARHAAERGVSLKVLLTEAVREHLQRDAATLEE